MGWRSSGYLKNRVNSNSAKNLSGSDSDSDRQFMWPITNRQSPYIPSLYDIILHLILCSIRSNIALTF